MKQENPEVNQPTEASPDERSGMSRLSATNSSRSSPTSSLNTIESSLGISPASPDDSGIKKELRRLNRALHALSGCSHALAQAGSEQELLEHRQIVPGAAPDFEDAGLLGQIGIARDIIVQDVAARDIPPMRRIMLRHAVVNDTVHINRIPIGD